MDTVRGIFNVTATFAANGAFAAATLSRANPFVATGIFAATIGTAVTGVKVYNRYTTDGKVTVNSKGRTKDTFTGKSQNAATAIEGISRAVSSIDAATATKAALATALEDAAKKHVVDPLNGMPKYIKATYTSALALIQSTVASLRANEATIATNLEQSAKAVQGYIANVQTFISSTAYNQIDNLLKEEDDHRANGRAALEKAHGKFLRVEQDLKTELEAAEKETAPADKNNAVTAALLKALKATNQLMADIGQTVQEMLTQLPDAATLGEFKKAYAALIGENENEKKEKTTVAKRIETALDLTSARAIKDADVKTTLQPINTALTDSNTAIQAVVKKDTARLSESRVRVALPMVFGFLALAAAFTARYVGPRFNVTWIK